MVRLLRINLQRLKTVYTIRCIKIYRKRHFVKNLQSYTGSQFRSGFEKSLKHKSRSLLSHCAVCTSRPSNVTIFILEVISNV
jgi:hypothetical protein